MSRPRIGCHLSIAGGVSKAVAGAQERGAEALQIFTTSPRQWAHLQHRDEEVAAFRKGTAAMGSPPVVVHAIYLLNPASPDPALRKKSASHLVECGRWSAALGATTVILHPGNAADLADGAGLRRLAAELQAVLGEWPAGVTLALEQSAGQRNSVGASLDHLRQVLDALAGDPRLSTWLDTAHAWGAGWDLTTADGVARFAADIDRSVGWNRVAGLHANDSKAAKSSRRDLHQNIGMGSIGDDGFRHLFRHPKFAALDWLLETPGLDGKGPDIPNMDRIRRLRSESAST